MEEVDYSAHAATTNSAKDATASETNSSISCKITTFKTKHATLMYTDKTRQPDKGF